MTALAYRVQRLGSILLILALVAGLSLPVSADQVIRIRADAWYPMNGEPGSEKPGYMIEFAQAIFGAHGYEVEYRTMPWSRSLLNVSLGFSDCVVGAYKEDAPGFVFPQTHWGEDQSLFWKRADSKWHYNGDLASLDGVRIGLIQDYAYSPAFDALMATNSDDAEFLHGNNALYQNIQKLVLGRIDVTVESRLVMEAKLEALELEERIVPAGKLGSPNPMYIACSPEKPESQHYVEWVDAGTLRLRETGELQAILARYGLDDWYRFPDQAER